MVLLVLVWWLMDTAINRTTIIRYRNEWCFCLKVDLFVGVTCAIELRRTLLTRGAPLPAGSSLPTRDSVGAGGHSGVRHGSDGKLGPGYVQGGGPSHRRGKAVVLLRVVVVRVRAFFFYCRNTAYRYGGCHVCPIVGLSVDRHAIRTPRRQ